MKVPDKKYLLIFIAFGVALVIWLHSILSAEQSTVISISVQYVNLSTDFSVSQLPSKAKFRVDGSGFNILKLKLSSFHLQYDASEISRNQTELNTKYFIISNVSYPGIHTIEPVIENLRIETEAVITASSAVELDFTSSASRQLFNDKRYRLMRERVEIKGPERFVLSVASVKTQPIYPGMLSKNKITLNLVTPLKQVELVDKSVDIIQFDEQSSSRVITRIRISSDSGIDFFPSELTVRISGLSSFVNSVSAGDIKAELIMAEEKNGEIPIRISAPPEVEVLDYSPQRVSRLVND